MDSLLPSGPKFLVRLSKHTCIIISMMFITTILYSQEITKNEIVKFKIKSVTTIDDEGEITSVDYFDSNGNLVKTGTESKGVIKTQKEFLYDDLQLLMEEKVYSNGGIIHQITKYFYDDKHRLIKKELLSPDKITATWTYDYDPGGNKIKETQRSGTMGNSVTIFRYEGTQLVEEEITNETIGKEEKINYKYNKSGQLTVKKSRQFYFNTTITLKYSYNEKGKLIVLSEKSSNGVSSKTVFQYDEKGLLIGDTWQSSLDKKLPSKTRYIIGY